MRMICPVLVGAVMLAFVAPGAANAAGCNQPSTQPLTHVELPGRPFTSVATADGCWIFVALNRIDAAHEPGIAVLKRLDGHVTLVRVVPLETGAAGMVLTHDGTLLIGAAGPRVVFLDARRAISGEAGAVLGYWTDGDEGARRIYVNVTSDDRYLFASNEGARSISVIDLAKARKSAFGPESTIGTIPVGNGPIALTFSPDGRYLYSTSQAMQPGAEWPVVCRPEADQQAPPNHAQGAVIVIDVKRATTDPPGSVVATVPSGCNPVRLAISPKGDVAYVTARGDHSLLAFDTKKLLSDPSRALIGKVRVGTAPVGVAVVDEGRRVIVTSSNRFAGGEADRQSLYVIDASRVAAGEAAVLGLIPAGGFPRELRVTSDKRTLLVGNFNSRTLEIIDLTRLPLQPLAGSAIR